MKTCLVASCGGHLAEVRAMKGAFAMSDHFFVVNDVVMLPDDMQGRTYFIRHSERDLLFFVNLIEAFRILRRERPTVILSTGAGPAVPFALIGKCLGIPNVYVEISTQVVVPSLTGRIMYYFADAFFYQWRPLGKYFPKGQYGGLLQWSSSL